APAELGPPQARVVVHVGGELLARRRVERQLAVEAAAGGVDEQRPANRGGALVRVDSHVLPGHVDEHGVELLLGWPRRLDLLEPLPDAVRFHRGKGYWRQSPVSP